jgi:predicted dehydrogenase
MNTPTRRDFLLNVATLGAGLMLANKNQKAQASATENTIPAGDNGVMSLADKPIDNLRVAVLGIGARGSTHLGMLLTFEGVEVVALCDNHRPSLDRALEQVTKAGRPLPAEYGKTDDDWKRMLERSDIHAVFVATPWQLHAPMGVATMLSGKHVFIEVPIALTVEECWQLVNTAEQTKRHCMMLENTCYGREELVCLNLCRLGLLGELLHGEAAYLHDLRSQMKQVDHGIGSWRTLHYAARNGNLYPTHGIGPIAQYMGINRSDRFDYLSSMSSPARGRALYAKEHFPADHKWNKIGVWKGGDMNTSIIKTLLGKTILLQWNETTPRPYSRLNHIQGTRGIFASFPTRVSIEGETHSGEEWTEGSKLNEFLAKYDHPLWKKLSVTAQTTAGGHGGMDYIMMWRIITCLRQGEPLDQNVYDSTSWSVLAPLTEWSVANRSQSIDVPDFTRGRWNKNEVT